MSISRSILFIVILLSFFGCKKPSNVGTGILPGDDDLNLIFNDTTTILSQTQYDVNLRSDKLAANMLGTINDPLFGKSSASILCQLGIVLGIKDTLPNYYVDSAVLYLYYTGFYGDTNVAQNFKVTKQDLDFDWDTAHYSNETPEAFTEIGRAENVYFKPTIKTKVGYSDTSGSTNLLRIKMSNFFAYSLVSQWGSNTMSSTSNFLNYLPGIYITPEGSSGNGMAQISTTNLKSKLVVYYHTDKDDSLTRDYPLYANINTFNKFQHSYAGTVVASSINSGLPNGDEINYIQGQSGVRTWVQFPTIKNYGTIAINKAELVVSQIYDAQSEIISPPNLLYVLRNDSADLPTNFGGIQASNVGGFADSTKDEFGRKIYTYKINITTFLQDVVLEKEENKGIYIMTSPIVSKSSTFNLNNLPPYRLMIGGSNNPNPKYKMKLNLKYTTLN